MKRIILGAAILMMSFGVAEASDRYFQTFNYGNRSGDHGASVGRHTTYKNKCRDVQGYGHVMKKDGKYKALIVATQCYDKWGRGYLVPGSYRAVRIIHKHEGGHHKGHEGN